MTTRPIVREFNLLEHPEYGGVGLAPAWMPEHQSDPLGGMGVAHDLLEHGARDTVEWQGLGGSVYVRGESYFHRRNNRHTAAENLASDFPNLFSLWEGADIPDPPRTRPLQDCEAEDIIQQAVREGCKLVRSECGGWDKDKADSWTREAQRARMVGWMRVGFRACVRRWRGIDQWRILETFCAVESAIDEFLRNHEDYKGSKVRVSFDPSSSRVSCELVEEWLEDYE